MMDQERFQKRAQSVVVIGLSALTLLLLLGVGMVEGCRSDVYPVKMEAGGSFNCFEFWLNRYQTLLAMLATIGAAYWGFYAIKQQMLLTQNMEERRLDFERFAARSVLPFALDLITSYAEQALQELERHRCEPQTLLSLPVFPGEAITPLKEATRFAQPDEREAIADLIGTAQVVVARSKNQISVPARTQMVIDFADLYARASNLFDFGRVSMNRHTVTVDNLRSTLRIVRIRVEDWPYLDADLTRRQESWQRHHGSREGDQGSV